jgi:SH3-like domain-containing protein
MTRSFLEAITLLAVATVSSAAASLPAAADPVVVGEEHCVIGVMPDDVLNLRTGPGAGYPVRDMFRPDACGIIVLAPCSDGWCKVEDDHNEGFVRSTFIAPVSPALYCVTGVATDDRLNVRSSPSQFAPVETTLAPDQCDIAFLPHAERGWQHIRVGGWQGWVARRYLSGE